MVWKWTEEDWKKCCGSTRFAEEMAAAGPFSDVPHAVRTARDVWLNKVDLNGWLEAFDARPPIGGSTAPAISVSEFFYSKWSEQEQSKAMSTVTDTTMEELKQWNQKYKDKFGFVFLICSTGKTTPEIISELKKRYNNRPIVELENAAHEEMKIIELRIERLATTDMSATTVASADLVTIAGGM